MHAGLLPEETGHRPEETVGAPAAVQSFVEQKVLLPHTEGVTLRRGRTDDDGALGGAWALDDLELICCFSVDHGKRTIYTDRLHIDYIITEIEPKGVCYLKHVNLKNQSKSG